MEFIVLLIFIYFLIAHANGRNLHVEVIKRFPQHGYEVHADERSIRHHVVDEEKYREFIMESKKESMKIWKIKGERN